MSTLPTKSPAVSRIRPRPQRGKQRGERNLQQDNSAILRWLHANALSLALMTLFLVFLGGMSIVGFQNYNDDQRDHGEQPITYAHYLATGSFVEAVGENWESEFLQMFAYVLLTAFLVQKGSSESKDPEKEEAVDEDPRARASEPLAPWPVRKGGFILKLYENSLSLAFFILFLISAAMHALGGAAEYNAEQVAHHQPTIPMLAYLTTARFWFESLQNWQSEFLAIAAMVVLTIFLRQRGSPESKPVASPHSSTGE
jgi:hypothetical protein